MNIVNWKQNGGELVNKSLHFVVRSGGCIWVDDILSSMVVGLPIVSSTYRTKTTCEHIERGTSDSLVPFVEYSQKNV